MRQFVLPFLVCCLISGRGESACGQTALAALKIGEPAPTFALREFDGEKIIYLRDYSGSELRWPNKQKQVVILSFFASWCIPCKTEIPLLHQFYETFKGEPIKIFLINYTPSEQNPTTQRVEADPKQRIERVSAFVKEQGYTLPVLLDEFGTTTRNFKVADERGRALLPHLFVIDREGVIRLINTGFSGSPQEFQRELVITISPLIQDAQ